MSNKRKWIIFLLTLLCFCIISLFLDVDKVFILVFAMWCICFTYAVSDLKQRSLFMAFLIAFFVFLIGGHFVYEYFGMEIKYYLGDEYYRHSNISLFISLLSIFVAYFVTSFLLNACKNKFTCTILSVSKPHERDTGILDKKIKTRNVSKALFYVTYFFWMIVLIEKVVFVQTSSYLDYYINFETRIPFAVNAIAAMCPYFLYLFLATFPRKSECRFPLILYALYAGVSLFTGRRGNLVYMIFFIFVYIILRHYVSRDNEKWITKKAVILLVTAIPIGLAFLYSYNYIRSGQEIAGDSFMEMFLGFFQQQGFSSSLIRLGKYHQSALNDNAYYSFFGIVKWARTNTVLKLIFNPQYDFSYLHNDVAFATKGNSFSNALSYIVLKNYLKGAGLGSCYIAELYHDFGYIGVVLGNFVYGIMMCMIGRIWSQTNRNVWLTALFFGIFESFIKAPRYYYDIVFQYALDLGMWSSFALVFGIVLLMSTKQWQVILSKVSPRLEKWLGKYKKIFKHRDNKGSSKASRL